MPFDMTTVLFVDDQDRYPQYRAEIALLLKAIGGASRYDFEIVKTLKSEAGVHTAFSRLRGDPRPPVRNSRAAHHD